MEKPITPATTDASLNSLNGSFRESLQEIVVKVNKVAEQCDGDAQALLDLLRVLETLHREIRANQFEPSLPNTRNDLYEFLKDIDETGGWPYIERMKLRAFFKAVAIDSEMLTNEAENFSDEQD